MFYYISAEIESRREILTCRSEVGRRAERVNHMDHLIINLQYHAYTVTDVYTILHDIISSCADIRKKPRQTRWIFL